MRYLYLDAVRIPRYISLTLPLTERLPANDGSNPPGRQLTPLAAGHWTREMQAIRDYFMEFVSPEPNSGCWLWDGSEASNGYGRFIVGQFRWRAHRASYELFVGPLPSDREICHRCHVRACVNPTHLYAGTHQENMADKAESPFRQDGQLKYCQRGHKFDEMNTRITSKGRRECRACVRLRNKRRVRDRSKAALALRAASPKPTA